MSVAADSTRRLDIGAVFTDTIAVLQRNIGVFTLSGLLLVGLPSLLSLALRWASPASFAVKLPLPTQTAPGVAAPVAPPVFPEFGAPVLLLSLAALACGLILQAGLFYAAAKDLEEGRRATLGELVSRGARRFLPLLGLYILVGLGVWIGAWFLLVPGIYLALRWCVAGPVLVVEGKGVFASMKRSAALTKGRRWALLLVGLIVFLVLAVLDAAFLGMMGGVRGAVAMASLTGVTPYGLFLTAVVSPLIGIVFGIVAAVFGGVLFHHLRSGSEGLSRAAIAEVFA